MGLHVFAYSNTTTAVPDFFHFIIFSHADQGYWCGFNFLFFFFFFCGTLYLVVCGPVSLQGSVVGITFACFLRINNYSRICTFPLTSFGCKNFTTKNLIKLVL